MKPICTIGFLGGIAFECFVPFRKPARVAVLKVVEVKYSPEADAIIFKDVNYSPGGSRAQ